MREWGGGWGWGSWRRRIVIIRVEGGVTTRLVVILI
jgi:hypothetical protein